MSLDEDGRIVEHRPTGQQTESAGAAAAYVEAGASTEDIAYVNRFVAAGLYAEGAPPGKLAAVRRSIEAARRLATKHSGLLDAELDALLLDVVGVSLEQLRAVERG